MERIIELFRFYTKEKPNEIFKIASSGSNRAYYRLISDNYKIIATQGTCVEENRAFIGISSHFIAKGLNVPKVLAVSDDGFVYLQEDLGDVALFDYIAKGNIKKEMLLQVISKLPKLQFEGAQGFDFSLCYPQKEFDIRSVSFDLNYFKYCFLKPSGIEFNEVLLEDDFDKLKEILIKVESNSFLYRDFQSRNIMIKDELPYFIDFQGGKKGPFYYDLASFVWQAKAKFSAELKNELVNAYKQALKKYYSVDDVTFNYYYKYFVLFRTLQVLGAYGFRGLVENKAHFLTSIPYAIDNLKELLTSDFSDIPYLKKNLIELTKLEDFIYFSDETGKLSVKIYSFAYNKGIPRDYSGNGGSYVFDCRGMHNPGRYQEYKKLTGMDLPVINFLEERGEVQVFMKNVCDLAIKHIDTYLKRNFTNLSFSFGCTGGQHRSVYCAEYLFKYLLNKYSNINVELIHREQNIKRIKH